jgi:hypothetical protein
MPVPTPIDLNDAVPVPPANARNIKWQANTANPRKVSGYVPEMVGDTGSGGQSGLVPAPAAGDADKFLRGDGTWAQAGGSAVAGITIDGGGSEPSLGSKGYLRIPFAGTITKWTILANQSGSAVIDVKKSTYSNFPTTASITGGNSPALATAQKAEDGDLSDWTDVTIDAGDVLEFELVSVTSCKRLHLELEIERA